MIWFISLLISSSSVFAEDVTNEEKLRMRIFPGGRDEQPLEVQASLRFLPPELNQKTLNRKILGSGGEITMKASE